MGRDITEISGVVKNEVTGRMTGAHNRRDALKMLLAISAAGAASCAPSSDASKGSATTVPSELSVSQITLLTALVDTIIPTTDTPGAVAAGVPATLAGLYKDWGDASFKQFWSGGLKTLGKTLMQMGGQDFAKLSVKQRESLLGRYDADVFDGKIDDGFYRDMKSTAATAYYMSEIGASEELLYDPVPGEWKGCVPFADIGRTWAT